MSAAALMLPKPGERRLPGKILLPDGREICRTGATWKARRRQAWERDGHCCQDCGIGLSLEWAEIDHVMPRRMGGGWRDDRLENLRTLCSPCHRRRHEARPQ